MNYKLQGEHIPAFLIASITSSCNLHCKGCYARANKSCQDSEDENQLSAIEWKRIFAESSELGVAFILLAGGEPLMRYDVLKVATDFKNIIFPIFTNGIMIDEQYMKLFDENRNLVPIVSIEGNEQLTDERRGKGTYIKIVSAMNAMNDRGILYGASITVTKENIHNVTSLEFISELYKTGCKVVFYVEYVPVTSATKHLAPTDSEREYLENALLELRQNFDRMIFIAFPGDERNSGGCLAAGRGFFHINSHGGAEPCPFSPYSDTNVKETSLKQALSSPLFQKLNNSDLLLDYHDGACVLFECEEEVQRLCFENKV